jgi:hypothetical protein
MGRVWLKLVLGRHCPQRTTDSIGCTIEARVHALSAGRLADQLLTFEDIAETEKAG